MTNEELQTLIDKSIHARKNGIYDEADTLATEVLAELDKPTNSSERSISSELLRGNALLCLADTAWRRGKYDTALEHGHQVLALAEEYTLLALHPRAHNLIGIVYKNLGNYDKSLEHSFQALSAHEALGEKSAVARVTCNIGIVYSNIGNYAKSLEYYFQALSAYEALGEKSGVASVTDGIGNLYNDLGNYAKSLEYLSKALSVHEELGEKSGVARVTGNIGNVYISLGNYAKSLEYLSKALSIHEALGVKSLVANVTGNIGNVYYHLGNYTKSLEYWSKAVLAYEALGVKPGVAIVTGNIGSLYATQKFEGYNSEQAEEYLLKAIALNEEIGAKRYLYENEKTIAELYKTTNRKAEAYDHLERYHELEKEVQSEETKKQAAIMEQQKQEAEREKTIAIANAKHAATEQLLHNVLPPSIANKMLSGKKLIAEKLSNVSVLFADIVEFTKLSQRISPEELVEGLDSIFSEFDTLAEKYGLEKIKTIGDAYMVVSGAPEPRSDHAEAMIHFAVEMLERIKQFKSISTGEQIELRIGIHTGEVVAGVIGRKKFAYDLWGDAVNTASRMESYGEAGKIHVSEDFKHAVETLHTTSLPFHTTSLPFHATSLQFILRGEMDIKGKGMMKTYFLEQNNIRI